MNKEKKAKILRIIIDAIVAILSALGGYSLG